MSIKPCPACESADYVNFDCLYDEAMNYRRECANCGTCGPWAETFADADAAWNAMPRRGDGPAWRSEPPDRLGWWWVQWADESRPCGRNPGVVLISDSNIHVYANETPGIWEWAGPIPEPPAPDAGKEAAKWPNP